MKISKNDCTLELKDFSKINHRGEYKSKEKLNNFQKIDVDAMKEDLENCQVTYLPTHNNIAKTLK